MASSRVSLVLLALEALAASVSALRIETLLAREARTNATCSPEFIWANNAQGKTPCRLAAEVIAPCHGGNWDIRDLPTPDSIYNTPGDNPNAQGEPCSCSWAAYNLMSACAACQGYIQAVRPWPTYKLNCPANALSEDSYYPSELVLADDTTLPFWATTNPTQWPGSTWTIREARSIYDQGKPDVRPDQVVTKKSSAGPIAGGVIGGLVVILAAAAIAFFLLKRHRKKIAIANGSVPPDPSGHYRSPSDATDKSVTTLSYTHLSSSPGLPTGITPTIRTHETSNYPFSVFGTPERVSVPATTTSPAHSRQISGEAVITPFTLNSPSPDSMSLDRKVPLAHVPRYDSPNAPPPRADDMLFETPRRGRINPPAYSPSPPPVSSRGGPSHIKNGSTDSHRTRTSVSGGIAAPPPVVQRQDVVPDHSLTEIETTPFDAMSGVPEGTTLGSESASAYPRDIKRRPTDDSFTGRDLA